MNRITVLSMALITTAAVLSAGCNRRDDPMTSGAPGAGPATSTTPSTTTAPDTTTSPAMPPASAASQ